MAIAVYLTLFAVTIGYAAVLERLHDLYTPDWTWLTVVVGNALIGFALLALCLIGELPLLAFWHLLGLNVTAGCVVIAWQVWQVWHRKRERGK